MQNDTLCIYVSNSLIRPQTITCIILYAPTKTRWNNRRHMNRLGVQVLCLNWFTRKYEYELLNSAERKEKHCQSINMISMVETCCLGAATARKLKWSCINLAKVFAFKTNFLDWIKRYERLCSLALCSCTFQPVFLGLMSKMKWTCSKVIHVKAYRWKHVGVSH